MTEPRVERAPRVLLVTRTDVTARGVRQQSWRVKYNDGWLSVAECLRRGMGERQQTQRSLPPGCQSLQVAQLTLPVGTEVERLLTEPDAAAAYSLDRYLGAGQGPRSLTQRVRYRVGACGKLEAMPKA